MSERGGDATDDADPETTTSPRMRTLATWVQAVVTILAVSIILATKLLPHAAGKAVSSVLQDAMVIVFIIALPFLEVIIWRLLRQLPAQGRLGSILMVVGVGIGVPVGTGMVFATIFLPTLSPPAPINVALLVVLCAAFACMLLGLLLVFVGIALDIVRFFQRRRQARMDDGRPTRG